MKGHTSRDTFDVGTAAREGTRFAVGKLVLADTDSGHLDLDAKVLETQAVNATL
jgi:hypothetical protein